MALFNVEGWSIKTKTVAFDNKTNKSSKDKKKNKRKNGKLTREQKLKEETEAELKEQVEDIASKGSVAKDHPKKKIKRKVIKMKRTRNASTMKKPLCCK